MSTHSHSSGDGSLVGWFVMDVGALTIAIEDHDQLGGPSTATQACGVMVPNSAAPLDVRR